MGPTAGRLIFWHSPSSNALFRCMLVPTTIAVSGTFSAGEEFAIFGITRTSLDDPLVHTNNLSSTSTPTLSHSSSRSINHRIIIMIIMIIDDDDEMTMSLINVISQTVDGRIRGSNRSNKRFFLVIFVIIKCFRTNNLSSTSTPTLSHSSSRSINHRIIIIVIIMIIDDDEMTMSLISVIPQTVDGRIGGNRSNKRFFLKHKSKNMCNINQNHNTRCCLYKGNHQTDSQSIHLETRKTSQKASKRWPFIDKRGNAEMIDLGGIFHAEERLISAKP
ncbi:unnamed protein product [Notodromas monacha]|uniref:Uncharacterized protein n=1 Tax=Notodromas monacha TaxID=399045 RepID=A0A7R9BMW3_9CRUS|nr:unnamed protein product [Notodromas monacha]CAG0917619.1 unnamed protein product [Notodromas monacha]